MLRRTLALWRRDRHGPLDITRSGDWKAFKMNWATRRVDGGGVRCVIEKRNRPTPSVFR